MKERVERVRKAMQKEGISSLLAFHGQNVSYLSGFTTTARPHWQIGQTACLLTTEGQWQLFLPSPWETECTAPEGCEVIGYTGGEVGLAQALRKALPASIHTTVADLPFLPASMYRALLQVDSSWEFVDQSPLLERCRMIKFPEELEALRKAVAMMDIGLETAQRAICAGKTERQAQAEINAAMLLAGSEGNGFTTKVICGPNGSRPHHMAEHIAIPAGSTAIVDLSATYQGYESDSARTFLLPGYTPQMVQIHRGITQLLLSLEERMRPGVPIRDICAYIRQQLTNICPDGFQAPTIGHGVGLYAHEYPDITATTPEILQENMLLAVEPAIYLPGQFGVRIENMFHIQSDHAHIMNGVALNQY